MNESKIENQKLEQQLLTELPLIDTTSIQPFINTHVVGSSSQAVPFDRYHKAALFIAGYCSISEKKVIEVAKIIRDRAEHEKPYHLINCQKCKTDVELDFYEGDEDECSYPHYHCPKCRANYYDSKGKERWIELDNHYEELEERFRESQFDNDDDW